MHLSKLIVAAAFAVLTLPGVALAQPSGHGHGGAGHGGAGHVGMSRGGPPGGFGGHFAAGPVGHFGARDLATWRAGYWWHGWRGGRLGWWWCADGDWYWYAAPIYPYPDVVADDYVPGDYPGPSAPMWYYCYDPPGYYPWVRACAAPWRPIPANPQPPPPPGQSPPPGGPPPQ